VSDSATARQAASQPSVAELVFPPGYFWRLPLQRYEFPPEERTLQVGTWKGVEQSGQVEKVGKSRVCDFYRVPALLSRDEISSILRHVRNSPAYLTEPDSVDQFPTFEYYPFQHGKWVDEGMRPLLEQAMQDRVLPYIRKRYGRPTCAVADFLIRRYIPGERRTHAVHFDGHAFVTAVL